MAASLSFKKQDGTTDATTVTDIKNIVYEDASGQKYTFGVDGGSVFSTFKYHPSRGTEVDYSTTAKNFMDHGAVSTLLDISTKVGTIETATNATNLGTKLSAIETATNTTNLQDKLDGIKAKTDKMSDDLGTELSKLATIETAVNKTNLQDKLDGIKAKTDKMPADLGTELGKLTTMGNLINSTDLSEAATTALQSFNKAVTDIVNGPNFQQDVQSILQANLQKADEKVGNSAQTWFKNNVGNTMSKPVFAIPTDETAPLSWDL